MKFLKLLLLLSLASPAMAAGQEVIGIQISDIRLVEELKRLSLNFEARANDSLGDVRDYKNAKEQYKKFLDEIIRTGYAKEVRIPDFEARYARGEFGAVSKSAGVFYQLPGYYVEAPMFSRKLKKYPVPTSHSTRVVYANAKPVTRESKLLSLLAKSKHGLLGAASLAVLGSTAKVSLEDNTNISAESIYSLKTQEGSN